MAISANKTYFIKRYSSSAYLNVYGNSYTGDMQPIKLWTKVENDPMQKWQFDANPSSGAYLCTMCDLSRAINLYSVNTPNCTLYAKSGNATDGLVKIQEHSSGVYYIYLPNRNLYLTANSTSNGTQVTWASKVYPASITQLWVFEPEVEESLKVPSDVPSAIVNKYFFVKNHTTGLNLNVNGYDTVANSTNVNAYNKEDCLAQRWIAKNTDNGPKLFTKINGAFALNIYGDNCTMYTASGNDEDSLLEFVPYSTSQKIYRIKMYHHNKYLRAEGTASGSNVAWSSSDDIYTLWQFVDEDDMFPTADPTPSAIKDQTFFLKAGNSNCYLNVHGSDTVVNTRNVNVYSKSNCLAQRWVARDTTAGPKLFTKIDETFALNIYNNDCTMYTAAGNDNDSVLEFEYVAAKQYKIKMFNHDKYLAVDGEIISGANVIWVDSSSSATVWNFESEADVFPPAPNAPTEIVDKTFFLRAGDTSYFLNVHGSDTVVNTRNVDIFTAENCLAQRWVARDTTNGPKLFTKIDETFAINIYNNDCTMYTASGNDADSILQFVKVGTLKYKIKMFHHDKYLSIDGTPSLGSDAIWVDNIANATIWNFIDETELDLPEGNIGATFTADSTLVTTVIPAHTNNFTQGRTVNGGNISEICIHHAAGNISVAALGALWQNPNRAGSSHYGVNGTQVGQYVKESDIAWTNGHWESNKRSVTIETANSAGDPDWLVSDETLDTLIKLVADIARRNCLGVLTVGTNLTYHSMYSATLCPGPYLLSKMEYIAEKANKINNEYISDVVYLRKHNTEYFLGIDSNNNVILTDMDSASPWKISGQSNSCRILSANNTTLSLQNNNGTPVVSSISSNTYGVIDSHNELIIHSQASAKSRTSVINYMLSVVNGIMKFKTDNNEIFDIVSNANSEKAHILPSEIPNELSINKFYFIKSNNKYLTFENGGFYMKNIVDTNEVDKAESQFWKIVSANEKFRIEGHSLLSNALGIHELYNSCVSRPLSDYDSNSISIIKDIISGKYCIRNNTYNKYLYPDIATPYWGSKNEEAFCWEFEDAYIIVDGWLRMHLAPQSADNAEPVQIPTVTPYTVNNITYKFENRNNWFSNEGPMNGSYTKENGEIVSPTGINHNAYRVITELSGKEPIVITENQALVDEKGFYWIAVGPKVIFSDFPDSETPGDRLYGNGTLDVVVKNDAGTLYYIHCVVGDIKNHTFNNGVLQTWYTYPNGEEFETYVSGISEYDSTVCAEFITSKGLSYYDNIPLGDYAVENIIFYRNPI